MSAALDTELFVRYFSSCPIVSGKLHWRILFLGFPPKKKKIESGSTEHNICAQHKSSNLMLMKKQKNSTELCSPQGLQNLKMCDGSCAP